MSLPESDGGWNDKAESEKQLEKEESKQDNIDKVDVKTTEQGHDTPKEAKNEIMQSESKKQEMSEVKSKKSIED